MRKFLLISLALLGLGASALLAQTPSTTAKLSTEGQAKSPAWFPHNWIRGYIDFDVAPSHNEPDLARCSFPQTNINSQCTAYGRYFMGGYVELQPLNRTIARHLFLFFTPLFTFGNNIPQLKYTASMEPMAFDRAIGVGFKLPKNFEVRWQQHQVDWLGRYSGNLGSADLHTNGPYGLYSTVGVRWNFGGYAAASGSPW